MPLAELVQVAVGAAGGSAVVVGAMALWLGKVWGDRIARLETLAADFDRDVRNQRLRTYPALWRMTEILPKWPRATGVTYEMLQTFSIGLRDWYFENGIYLSESTMNNGYRPLQDAMTAVLQTGATGPISDEHYGAVRDRCSTLRTHMTKDLGTRRENPIE